MRQLGQAWARRFAAAAAVGAMESARRWRRALSLIQGVQKARGPSEMGQEMPGARLLQNGSFRARTETALSVPAVNAAAAACEKASMGRSSMADYTW